MNEEEKMSTIVAVIEMYKGVDIESDDYIRNW